MENSQATIVYEPKHTKFNFLTLLSSVTLCLEQLFLQDREN